MAAGQFVFPVVIIAFVAYMGSFLVSTPADQPLAPIAERTMQAAPGDVVTIEITAYYGQQGDAFAFYTTQEERAANLPRGRVTPRFEASPLRFEIPEEGLSPTDLPALLIGHRVGDAFTSPLIPAAQSPAGDWEARKNVSRTLITLPIEERIDSNRFIGGAPFNATTFAQLWRARGFELQPGTTFPCEDPNLWSCRLVSIDYEQHILVYERLVTEGASFPMAALMRVSRVESDVTWTITTVAVDEDSFDIRLNPPAGDRFQFRAHVTTEIRAGTYEVLALHDSTIEVNYTSASNDVDPELVGQPTFYDIVIVRIDRPEPGT